MMTHTKRFGPRLGLLGLLVSTTGCAFGEPDATGDVAEGVATTNEAIVHGWSRWSNSSKYLPGVEVGCHSGSLISGVERQGSSTRIFCAGPIPNSENTNSRWLPWTTGPEDFRCESGEWVTGYQSASWLMGSGFRLRCSKVTDLTTGKPPVIGECDWQTGSNSSGPTYFRPYYLIAGECGATCATLKWLSCRTIYGL
jgi:hypothetical protein